MSVPKHALRIFLPSALLLLAGCGGGSSPAPAAGSEEAGEAAAAQPGTTCPTCGMAVDENSPTVTAGGMTFRVCNPRCGEIVAKDPQKWAAFALPK